MRLRLGPWLLIALTLLLAFSIGHVSSPKNNSSTKQSSTTIYTLKWIGYDWDGQGEEKLTLNGNFLASLPSTNAPQNSGVYTSFSLDITPQVNTGSNTLAFTHANWDCSVIDSVKDLEVDNQTGIVFTSSVVSPLGCNQPLTYQFNVAGPSPGPPGGGGTGSTYSMSWMGYDWDGQGEETISLNGHVIAALPTTNSPQNSGVYSSFSLDITSRVVSGSNVLTFTHANWDCAVSDNVENLQVTNSTGIVFSNNTVSQLSCGQPLTFQFNTSSSSSGGGGGGSGSNTVPALIGWGGVRLDEAAVGGGVQQPSNPPPSAIFPGEVATNMELLLTELKPLGYNIVKVSFDPSCTGSQYMSPYDATNLQRAVQIAQHFDFWIVIDYHGFTEPFVPSQSSCWMNFWSGVVSQFKNSYSKIIWEPEDEPKYGFSGSACSGATACISYLSGQYQQWINQDRSLGDTHWIVVENICSFGCSLCPGGDGACPAAADGFPTVTDPLGTLPQGGRVFISLHTYMDYGSYSGAWNNATAESVAQAYYQTMLSGTSKTGWPVLDTENGASPLCGSCTPDQVLTGNAGYSQTTFHMVQTLTNLLDNNTPQRIDWINWPAGSWTDTPGAGIYGAMQCSSSPQGWGCILTFKST